MMALEMYSGKGSDRLFGQPFYIPSADAFFENDLPKLKLGGIMLVLIKNRNISYYRKPDS
jgi:hypothetical protein